MGVIPHGMATLFALACCHLYVCVHTHAHVHVEERGQLSGVSALLPCVSPGGEAQVTQHSGQALLPCEPFWLLFVCLLVFSNRICAHRLGWTGSLTNPRDSPFSTSPVIGWQMYP